MSSSQNELDSVDIHVPNKKKLPLYGPLSIEDQEEFLDEEAKRFLASFNSPFPYNLKTDNFQLLYQLGAGAFGVVILVKYKLFGSCYAMKVLSKKDLVERDYVKKALNEKLMLQSLNCPFTIYLLYFSQDNSNIYFILPFVEGGELYNRLVQFVRFNENVSKFYAAQVVLAFEYLHRCNVIYRDLKPENILIDHFGYIKITDFGLAKLVSHRTYTFCGTPDYVAPEVVLSLGYGKAIDWWALGVLIFEMSSGRTPFFGHDVNETLENIVGIKYVMPKDFNEDLKDIIESFLQYDVTKRMGNLKCGVEEIKSHPWFREINWLALLNRRVVPPYIPYSKQLDSTAFPDIRRVSKLHIAKVDQYEESFSDF